MRINSRTADVNVNYFWEAEEWIIEACPTVHSSLIRNSSADTCPKLYKFGLFSCHGNINQISDGRKTYRTLHDVNNWIIFEVSNALVKLFIKWCSSARSETRKRKDESGPRWIDHNGLPELEPIWSGILWSSLFLLGYKLCGRTSAWPSYIFSPFMIEHDGTKPCFARDRVPQSICANTSRPSSTEKVSSAAKVCG